MSTMKSEQPIISNAFVTCYSDHFVIHTYYFPVGSRTIKYSDIKSCELLPMRDLGIFKRKVWGMALSSVWWHSDLGRNWRESYILLDTNQWPKIGITMDDSDIMNVYKIIKQNMNIKSLSEKKSFDHIETPDANMIGSMLEEEREHEKFLGSNGVK